METEKIRQYGKYVRHLLELSRDGEDDAVEFLLDSMDDRQLRDILILMLCVEARMK